ncbi:MAG: hypothetical protein C4527_02025 [Candidatus Omnitrophota bacterium]|nr:MAG: hypothetical protein C4527_02025 [Candidatus Omnitrophota bacterium]
MLDDYSSVAEQFKESLIQEFLKKNPKVKKEEIVTRTVNGRIVIDTIDHVFKHAAGQRKVQETVDRKKINELLEKGEKRLASSLESLQSSRQYAQWLYRSRFADFSEKEKDQTLLFLAQKEDACGKCAIVADSSKQKLLEVINQQARSTSSLVRTLLQETLQSVLDLLKCQGAIFKREVELGDQVSVCMRDFIQSTVSVAQALVKPTTVNAMARAYQILKNETIDATAITKAENIKKLKQAVDELESNLKQRRDMINSIQQLVHFVESVLEAAGQLEPKEKPSEPALDSKSAPTRRMAFTSRLNRR